MTNEKDKVIAELNTEMGKLQAELAGLQAKFASNKSGLENTKKILEREITVRDETDNFSPAFTCSNLARRKFPWMANWPR